MKSMVPGGVVRALVALGLVSYHAVPALAVGKVAAPAPQLQWVTQLIVKEKSNGLKTQSVAAGDTVARADVATMQRWSAAAQLPVTYKRAMSGGAHVVTLPQKMLLADAQAVAERMEASGQFEYVSPDRIMRPMAVANDPLFATQQWNLWPSTVVAGGPSTSAVGGANVTTAWDTTTGANTVNVGIVDTGILPHHADFVGLTFNTGYNFIKSSTFAGTVDPKTNQAIPVGFVNNGANNSAGNNDPTDPGDWLSAADAASFPTLCGGQSNSSWHGTFVAGIIAAQRNNGQGIAGIAPGVRVQMARALGKCGGSTSDIMDGLTWLTGGTVPGIASNPTPAKIVNMSLGGVGSCSTAEQTAITNARNAGALVVVATGNEGSPSAIDAPANCVGTVAVTAHTVEGDSANYANVGSVPPGTTLLSAPGGGNGSAIAGSGALIPSLSNNGTTSATTDAYVGEQGTSMATPHVAAVAALLLSVKPTLTPDDLTSLLKQSARPFPAGTYCATHAGVCGAGMLDAGAAVSAAAGNPVVRVAASVSSIAANNSITLTAVGGAGFGNTVSGVQWAQTSGPATVTLASNGPDGNSNYTATLTPTTPGTYTFSVTLANSAGGTATDSTSVTITAAATTTPGTGTGGNPPFSGGTSNTGNLNQSGGGGALPLWLAGLLLTGGAFGFSRGRRNSRTR